MSTFLRHRTLSKTLRYSSNSEYNCPCSYFPGRSPPSFVRENYYCESGTVSGSRDYFTDDPVWDGKGCSDDGKNCCSDLSLPWFYRQIPLTISDDIETRICYDHNPSSDKDVLIKELQLYAQ